MVEYIWNPEKERHDLNPAHVRSDDSDTGEAEDSGPTLRSSDGDYNLHPQLVQRYAKVPCGSRIAVLLSVLKNLFDRDAGQKVAVFFSTCDAVDFLYTLISQFLWPPNSAADSRKLSLGCKTFRLHGSMKQDDRRSTIQTFKTEKMLLPEAWTSLKSDVSFSMTLRGKPLNMCIELEEQLPWLKRESPCYFYNQLKLIT